MTITENKTLTFKSMVEIRNKIDGLIMEAIKARDKDLAEVYKAIKNEFLIFRTAKNAKPLDDVAEVAILQKMVKQREDAASQFAAGNRADLSDKELYEAQIISKMLPKVPSREDVIEYINSYYSDGIEKSQMGQVIKNVRVALPGADGKMVSEIVKSNLI